MSRPQAGLPWTWDPEWGPGGGDAGAEVPGLRSGSDSPEVRREEAPDSKARGCPDGLQPQDVNQAGPAEVFPDSLVQAGAPLNLRAEFKGPSAVNPGVTKEAGSHPEAWNMFPSLPPIVCTSASGGQLGSDAGAPAPTLPPSGGCSRTFPPSQLGAVPRKPPTFHRAIFRTLLALFEVHADIAS